MAKKSTTKKTASKTKVTKKSLNETGKRKVADRRQDDVEVSASGERRKTQRRRQIDPTTCERDYTNEEVEFMQALDQYKRDSGRMFPTCSEILEVIRNLGYSKRESQVLASQISNLTQDTISQVQNSIEI